MPNYSCNNCGNTFARTSSAQLICPACGSNSVNEIQEQSKKSFWLDKKILVLAGALLLMIIILFFLKTPIRQYSVEIEPYPDSCMFRIIVKAGDKIQDPDQFMYSVDNVWGKENLFKRALKGQYRIQVKFQDDTTRKFMYNFVQPYSFTPTCNVPEENPCDCKFLQVKSVATKFINGKSVLVVDALPLSCPKEYSFTGKEGKYISDSIIIPSNDDVFNIWVRTRNCEPKAYIGNPVVFKIPKATGQLTKLQLEKLMERLITSKDETIKRNILVYFQDGDVNVQIVEDGEKTTQTVSKLLNDLRLIGLINDWKIKVIDVKYDKFNKIRELTVER
jgi:hypothetical protein